MPRGHRRLPSRSFSILDDISSFVDASGRRWLLADGEAGPSRKRARRYDDQHSEEDSSVDVLRQQCASQQALISTLNNYISDLRAQVVQLTFQNRKLLSHLGHPNGYTSYGAIRANLIGALRDGPAWTAACKAIHEFLPVLATECAMTINVVPPSLVKLPNGFLDRLNRRLACLQQSTSLLVLPSANVNAVFTALVATPPVWSSPVIECVLSLIHLNSRCQKSPHYIVSQMTIHLPNLPLVPGHQDEDDAFEPTAHDVQVIKARWLAQDGWDRSCTTGGVGQVGVGWIHFRAAVVVYSVHFHDREVIVWEGTGIWRNSHTRALFKPVIDSIINMADQERWTYSNRVIPDFQQAAGLDLKLLAIFWLHHRLCSHALDTAVALSPLAFHPDSAGIISQRYAKVLLDICEMGEEFFNAIQMTENVHA